MGWLVSMANRGRVSKWVLVRRGRVRSLPVRIPPVPAKEWLRAGPLTRITPEIQALALSFKGSPRSIALQALRLVRGFEVVRVNQADLQRFYAKRSADDICHSRKVVLSNDEASKRQDVQGCVDYSVALAALLRARQIPAIFVRRGNHSTVRFFSGAKWFEADALANTINELTPNQLASIRRQRVRPPSERSMGEGLDPHDIGIRSIADFYKFGVRRGPLP